MSSGKEVIKDSLLILDGKIKAFGEEAKEEAFKKNLEISNSGDKLIAPLLVDIHSTLKNPLSGHDDNLQNLKSRAKKSGYGTVAILPQSDYWRDMPEKIPYQKNDNFDLNIFFWGSFSLDDKGLNLSPHQEILDSGAIGLSTSNFFDSSIILKGLKLDAVKSFPILFSTTSKNKYEKGIVQRDLTALQTGFFIIDNNNESSHVKNILEVKNIFPSKKIIIKNLSDSKSLREIQNSNSSISTTVSWWSLVADTNNLKLDDIGWKADPPLGSPQNREDLIKGLENEFIDAIAVNSYPLNDQNTFIPINERALGISSFELVLPLLWKEFINKRKWKISKLWKHLSFKPSNLLGITEERLSLGSQRWLIFDPKAEWINNQFNLGYDSPCNFPKKNELIKGKVIEAGLNY